MGCLTFRSEMPILSNFQSLLIWWCDTWLESLRNLDFEFLKKVSKIWLWHTKKVGQRSWCSIFRNTIFFFNIINIVGQILRFEVCWARISQRKCCQKYFWWDRGVPKLKISIFVNFYFLLCFLSEFQN